MSFYDIRRLVKSREKDRSEVYCGPLLLVQRINGVQVIISLNLLEHNQGTSFELELEYYETEAREVRLSHFI